MGPRKHQIAPFFFKKNPLEHASRPPSMALRRLRSNETIILFYRQKVSNLELYKSWWRHNMRTVPT